MVLAYHLIMTAYGFWLPNDPRGSWSDFVGAWELLKFGRATKVATHESLARRPHDRELRLAAKRSLKYPPVLFSGEQARMIGVGMKDYIGRAGLVVHACSILPDHLHMVIARHRLPIEQIATQLKGAATRALLEAGLHPLARYAAAGHRPHTPWARGEWKVYLDSIEDILRAIRYVEANPMKEGLRRQSWMFVTPIVS